MRNTQYDDKLTARNKNLKKLENEISTTNYEKVKEKINSKLKSTIKA